MNMTISKIVALVALILSSSQTLVADDIGSAFMPDGQKTIKMNGTSRGDELLCKDSRRQDCQRIFNKVYSILDRSADLDHGNLINGYIKIKGKKRRNVKFTSIVKGHNGVDARMICEYDVKNDEFGFIWVDPSAR